MQWWLFVRANAAAVAATLESQKVQQKEDHIKLLQARGNAAVEQLHITADLKKLTEKELRRAQSKSVSPIVTHV